MNKIDIAYLAGLVDGEGYIGIKKSNPVKPHRVTTGYHARIQVRMIDEQAIKFLSETLGGKYYREKPHCNNGRPLYCWSASDKIAEKILRHLLPYLRVKRKQAEAVIEFRELQSTSVEYRTKVTGIRTMPHSKTLELVELPNLALSDEYIALCENRWTLCKKLNGR